MLRFAATITLLLDAFCTVSIAWAKPSKPTATVGVDISLFNWRSCPASKDPRWKCGHIILPLDWHNSSDTRTVQIETVLFQPNPKKKGERTIVVNPGGPGASGVDFAWELGEQISQSYSDSTFDVLGFDPRGVNASEPHIACYPRDAYADRWSLISISSYREKIDRRYQLDRFDALNEAFMRACSERYGDIPRFLTTASVARDLEAIRSAIGEPELTYFGKSYGSGLGETYSQMFPDRVGRMIFDALENIRDYRQTSGFGDASLYDVDRIWREGFIGECVKAGPKYCALVSDKRQNDTAKQVEQRMKHLFDSLLERPFPASQEDIGPGIIMYQHVVTLIYIALYRPEAEWADMASNLRALEDGDGVPMLVAVENFLYMYNPEMPPLPKSQTAGDGGTLVVCGDSSDTPRHNLDWWEGKWAEMEHRSFLAGCWRFDPVFRCRHFNWTASELYRGNLSHTLANRILLVGATGDPATPLRNGLELFKEMTSRNAHLIEHHAWGHGSTRGGESKNCTERIKREYMMTGKLPSEPVTQCYVDTGGPFKQPLVGPSSSSSHRRRLEAAAARRRRAFSIQTAA
ncbi:unnamed protein product [Parajaminaea phylloscopi]